MSTDRQDAENPPLQAVLLNRPTMPPPRSGRRDMPALAVRAGSKPCWNRAAGTVLALRRCQPIFPLLSSGRPVATALLTFAIALAGIVAFGLLPVAPLPQVDFPVVIVRAKLPGAGPETMAATVPPPLNVHLGALPGSRK